eukprot:TRINITY_DN3931_c0_g2_i1.p2 TRINITY_DN3931_c0_g2~~TRINITY_DN3931_c0_g2_i1.p2  ORF type:complete len:408 (-),score=101.89 TRINITY_DN3931_c0_g2_i1:1461-2684(-)
MALELRPLRTFSSSEDTARVLTDGKDEDNKQISFTPRLDHKIPTMFQSYPERTQYDKLLMKWTDQGFNWQKFRVQTKNLGIFTFPISKCFRHTESEDESFGDARFVTFEVSVGGKQAKALAAAAEPGGAAGGGGSRKSRFLKLFSKKKRKPGTPREDKYVLLKIHTAAGKVLISKDLSKITSIPFVSEEIEESHSIKSPHTKRRSVLQGSGGSALVPVEVPQDIVDETSRVTVLFGSLDVRQEFQQVAYALGASLVPESPFGAESLLTMVDSKSVITSYSLCVHQSNAKMVQVDYNMKNIVLDGGFMFEREVHLMLFSGRIVVLENDLVFNVLQLSKDTHVSIPKMLMNSVMGQCAFTLDIPEQRCKLVLLVRSEKDCDRWMEALKVAKAGRLSFWTEDSCLNEKCT